MQQWEYQTVRVQMITVLDNSERVVSPYLDPEIADWKPYCQQRHPIEGKSYWVARLASSPRGSSVPSSV